MLASVCVCVCVHLDSYTYSAMLGKVPPKFCPILLSMLGFVSGLVVVFSGSVGVVSVATVVVVCGMVGSVLEGCPAV